MERVAVAARKAGGMVAAAVWLIGLAGMPGDLDTWSQWFAWFDWEWVRFICIVVGVPVVGLWWYPRWLKRQGVGPPSDAQSRFQALALHLHQLAPRVGDRNTWQGVRLLAFVLDDVGVPTPDPTRIDMRWQPYLERMGNLAVVGDLETARREGTASYGREAENPRRPQDGPGGGAGGEG